MNKIFELINKSKSIIIMTHENPDGDAIGSVMGLYGVLDKLCKKVDILLPKIPPIFDFLPNTDKINVASDKKYDLAIVLDCSNLERIGQNNNEISNCDKIIVIDHHVANTNYGDINHVVSEAASCTEVIYYLLKENNIELDKEIGTCFMLGVLTDTSGFGNNNIRKETFLMTADMIDLGVDVHKLYYDVLLKKNSAQQKLMKITLDRLEFFGDGKVAFSYITKDDFDKVGARLGDHEGLVDIGRSIDGVMVSIFIREDDGYRVSFRSNGIIDVNKIASIFNGGGHAMAAGAKVSGNLDDIKRVLISETLKEINNQ